MGKHKHRRRERDSGYVQPQMNGGYNGMNMGMNQGTMGGQNQFIPNGMNPGMNMNQNGMMNGQGMFPGMDQGMFSGMDQGMNIGMNQGMNNLGMSQNMNPMNSLNSMMNNPIASLLGNMGGSGGPDLNGIIQLLNNFGLGIDPSLAGLFGGGNGGNFDIMQLLGGLLGGLGSQSSPASPTQSPNTMEGAQTQGYFDDLVAQITPDQINMIQGILQGFGINNTQQQNTASTAANGERKEDSLEEILANLDFNSILSNLNDENFFGLDFTNVNSDSLDDINVDDVVNSEEFDEDMGEVKDADIIEENILNKEKELSKEEYKKLINILIKLIDPNKIRLLQKVFSEYEKKVVNK